MDIKQKSTKIRAKSGSNLFNLLNINTSDNSNNSDGKIYQKSTKARIKSNRKSDKKKRVAIRRK